MAEWRINPAELIAGLSRALDLTEGEPMGHSIRTCWIGMRIAQALQLPDSMADDLYYALLLKDAGCSANAAQVSSWFGTDDHRAKADLKQVNWSRMSEAVRYAVRNAAPEAPLPRRMSQIAALAKRGVSSARELVQLRCTRGAQIVRSLGWSGDVPEAVLNLDEHWDGSGHPQGARGDEIPLMSRILLLSQTVEIFWQRHGPEAARETAAERSGRWFDPALVAAFMAQSADPRYFDELSQVDSPDAIQRLLPNVQSGFAQADNVLKTAEIFGQIVDSKSPWTRMHSLRTARYAGAVAEAMGLSADVQREVRLTGFFHDLGKLGVSNLILDKPGRLTSAEREAMERHAELTFRVLEPLEGLRSIAFGASCHHERLDGSGYYRRLAGDHIPVASQIVAVADVFDALTADRPYRSGLTPDDALNLMRADSGVKLSGDALEALAGLSPSLPDTVEEGIL